MARIASRPDIVPRILLLGKQGQVGWELQRTLAPLGDLIALDRADLDLTQTDAVRKRIREIKPTLIVNAAAYTAVDKAEDEPELAMRINGTLPGLLAEEANRVDAALIHYSTDYVFGGVQAPPEGYTEEMTPHPLNVYGKTKLAGERAVQTISRSYLIFRTSWVYGLRGNNFLLTMLRLAREREEIKVVNDQVGAPTWSRMIAEMTARVLTRFNQAASLKEVRGLYHLTAGGQTTWYHFAEALLNQSRSTDFRLKALLSIPSSAYPTRAPRPAFSLLDCRKLKRTFGLVLPDWEESLRHMLKPENA
ncbi:MAG: dTDP-4-dehydrorhamnose reductase [Nitrospira sp.]|nr:dTDP-4-dehydrorhamnose reductase [Candidatus Manganitrophaceae bacterium]HIL34697.1 dTDP-4-dehydrorhamnose reductase [Candidatus Manganitrophaceae bacterium]